MNVMLKTLFAAVTSATAACLLAGSAWAGDGVEPLTTIRVASGLTRPVFVTAPPGDYKRLFIIEQRNSGGVANQARIKILDLTVDPPVVLATPFLTITGVSTASEQGLLGLAFHPDYWTNGHFYVALTAGGQNVLRRYTVTSDPNVADPASVQPVWSFADPFSNHNGGWIAFGPDGYLYWANGDGGSGCDPGGRAQDITDQPLGKMHRLDVNGDDFTDINRNYAIPPSNPFVGIDGDDEIWAFGLRNPWRDSFDRLTGDLWIGDVGQDALTAAQEEISFQPASAGEPGDVGYYGGRNYGWKCREGDECSTCPGVVCATCTLSSMIEPLIDYNQGSDPQWGPTGVSITGGYVYRGCAIPSLTGNYFVADYAGNRIWTLRQSGGVFVPGSLVTRTAELDPPGTLSITSISSFGEDARGELYLCDLNGGEVFKVIPVTPTVAEQDLDCDGLVGGFDLALLLGVWGKCTSPGGCLADFDGNGTIDGLDLALLLGEWG